MSRVQVPSVTLSFEQGLSYPPVTINCMDIPRALASQAAGWARLKRWQRRDLGQSLRRLGLSYREIQDVIPVAKGTLSEWCRDIPLSEPQMLTLAKRGANRLARAQVGAKLRQRSLARAEAIRASARDEARCLMNNPLWVAGVVAYWAEGAKRHNEVIFSNSDPRMMKLFVTWAKTYLNISTDRLGISLHLHDGQDQAAARDFWSGVTGIPLAQFGKSFIKKEGTGHRKNILYAGTARIRVTRSSNLLHRIKGWIDAVDLDAPWVR